MTPQNAFKASDDFLGIKPSVEPADTVAARRESEELPVFGADATESEREAQLEAFRRRRANLARAAAQMVFTKDIDTMGEDARAGLFRAATKAIYGFEDMDGRVSFGKKAGDMKSNLERLRKFLKGDYSQIESEDVTKWRSLSGADEIERFNHANEHLKAKGDRDWDNGPGWIGLAGAGMPGAQFGNVMQNATNPTKEATHRKLSYDRMNEEEKAAFRADTIKRYERQIAAANPLDMFLKTAAGLSDPAAWTLAKCYRNGTVDVKDIENIADTKEREKVLTALSMMRGDKAKGRILGISTDFTDGTAANRAQLGIYGLQQAFLGLATDTVDFVKAGGKELQIYTKSLYDAEEAKQMRKRTDLEARIAAALRQPLPESETFAGAMLQGVSENIGILASYLVGGTGTGTLKGIKALRATLGMGEIAKAAKGAKAAATGLAFAKSEAGFVRQLAAFELYTERLKTLTDTADAAMKTLPKAGAAAKARGMVLAGRTAAFSTFASDYIETADAEGISRAESVPSAVLVGIINGAVEKFNLPGLESTITRAELKSLALRSAVEAFKHERSAGLRKWIADGVAIRAREAGRTVATEAFLEEPLQQFVTQTALEFDKTIGELREEGKLDATNAVVKLWSELRADGLGKAFRLYWDTAMESLPAAVGFGGVSVGMQRVRGVWRNADMRKETGDMSADEGILDVMERNRQARRMIAAHWLSAAQPSPLNGEGEGTGTGEGEGRATINRVNEAYSAARAAYGRRKVDDDTVRLVAEAAGVDRKTAEVLHDCLEVEERMALYSPRFRMEVNLADAVVDIDEKKLKAVLPEYVEGSFVADKAKGLYAAKINMPDGAEKTLVYRVGDMSEWIDEQIGENGLADEGELADSYEARRREMPEGAMKPWKELTQTERRDIALQGTDGFLSGRAGVFELTGADGKTIAVRADDIISLASGRIADVGYVGAQAKGSTLRHETFHALWRFAKGTLSKEDIAALYSHFPDLDPNSPSDRQLDERMAVEFERYASGNFVPMKPKGVLDRFSGWAFDKLGKLLDVVGVRREGVTDPVSGKPYTLSDFYDKVLRGELGSGELGVERRIVESKSTVEGEGEGNGKGEVEGAMNAPPGEVSEEEIAAARARNEEILSGGEGEGRGAGEGVSPASTPSPSPSATPTPTTTTTTTPTAYTAENPADASVANAKFYRIGLPNSEVKLVGRLEVRDVEEGVTTSTDEDYHDRGNQNRDDKSEESRGLVMKIAGRPDPLQVGTVQPIANNGIVWALPNGDIIIGNHRVNGVRAGYEKGTAGDLEKFVREDAAKRGIEIGENVKKPLMVFVLERIESPEGQKTADVHEVVRLANESQNRGFNIREQAGNDAKILTDNHLLPRMAFRADGRIDETKSADAIGKFRQESGAQGLVGEDGMLTEEGQTRIQNAALAALLGGTGNAALLQRIMERSGTLDMASQVRALMKMTPDLMALADAKPDFDLRPAIGEALELFTEWREADEEKRVEKGKSRHDWRERGKDGGRIRGLSWEAFMSQGDMFRKPSEEAQILGDLFARTEELRSFDREDVESAAGKKRVVDLISGYLADYIANARAVNTETDDMFGAPPASRADVLQAQRARGENGARFSMAAPVERSKNLIAVHNLKPSDLAAAAELEGMPAPSIAVVKDSMGHDNYGPISLVFRADAIDPKGDRNNKIYSSDAWTPTRGNVHIEYKVLDDKLDEIVESLKRSDDEDFQKLFKAFSERGSLSQLAETAIADGEYYRLWHNDAILLSYLTSQGKKVPVSYREEAISHLYSNAVVKGVSDAVGDKVAEIWENGGKSGDEAAEERLGEIMRPAAVVAKDNEDPEKAAERRAQGIPTLGEKLYGTALKRPWNLADAVMRYREHGFRQVVDTFAVSKTMNEMLSTDDPAYQEWVRKTFAPAVGAKGIRNKLDVFTPRGNRRSWEALHDEVTAQRIVDMMYHNSNAVGGNGFGGYNPEGAAVRQYASIAEMRRDRDRLQAMPEAEWNKLRDETRKDFIAAVSSLQSKQKHFYSDNPFVELDSIQDIVLQAWIAAKGDKEKYLANCKDELHVYDESDCSDIWDVMMRLRNAPTKYFEAKPERVVGFDEVAFAVVPDDSSAETLEILKNHGIKTHTYKAEDKEDRLRAVNKAADENDTRFSIAQLSTGEKFVLLDRTNKIDWNDRDKVREYLTTLVGTGAVSLIDGERIEIGKDLPVEYTRSKYAEKAFRNIRLRKVRAKAAQHFDELIAVASERTSEPAKHKKREGGVYFRRKADFAVFGHEVKRGYSAELVTYEENGQEYLYDLVNIKDKPSLVPDSATGGNGGFEILSTYNGEGDAPNGTPRIIPQGGSAAQARFSIGGIRGAEKLGIGNVAEAEKMEQEGASREVIWRKTGWWRAKDGKWRVELPDVQLKSPKEVEAALKKHKNSLLLEDILVAPELFKAYPELAFHCINLTPESAGSTKASYSPDTHEFALYGVGQLSLANLDKDTRDTYRSVLKRAVDDGYLKKYISNCDALGVAHGTFKEEREKAKAQLKAIEKAIADGNKKIIKEFIKNGEANTSRIVHEIQHWIQFKEGFAEGGSPESAAELVKEMRRKEKVWSYKLEVEEMAKKLNTSNPYEIEKAIFDLFGAKNREDVINLEKEGWIPDQAGRDKGYNLFARGYDKEGYEDAWNEYLGKMRENNSVLWWDGTPHELYRRLAGEVEARNAQKRLNMLPLERAAIPPWQTEDVPENRQIVRFSVSGELMGVMQRNAEKVADQLSVKELVGTDKGVYVAKIDTGNPKTSDGKNTVIVRRGLSDTLHLIQMQRPVRVVAPVPEFASNEQVKYTPEQRKAAFEFVVEKAKSQYGEVENRDFGEFRIDSLFKDEVQRHAIARKCDMEAVCAAKEIAQRMVHFAASPNEEVGRKNGIKYFEYGLARVSLSDGDYLVMGEVGEKANSAKYYDQRVVAKLKADFKVSPKQGPAQIEKSAFDAVYDSRFRILMQAVGEAHSEKPRYSTAPGSRSSMSFAYPNLAFMSNEELFSAAIAAKMALGKSDKVSDRMTTVNAVQKKLRAIHPEWDTTKVALESQRILGEARTLAKSIRGDIDRGVSDSLILEHLPKSMRGVFGEEMTGEARRGWRLGMFQAKAEAGVERRIAQSQERLMRDALEVETGMMHGDIERSFGVDLAATLLHVKENEYLKVLPKSAHGEGNAAAIGEDGANMGMSVAEEAFSSGESVEELKPKVSAFVQAIADRAEGKAQEEAEKRRKAKERAEKRVESENINDTKGDEEPDVGMLGGGEFAPEEVVAEAVKAGVDLNNPLSFTLFVMEMARTNWVKKHNLKPDAEPAHSLVYLQFQRKTLQDVYSTLAKRITYSRGRETVMNALARLDKVTTMRGLVREGEFMGKLVGAKMIRESAQAMCERLDNLLKTEFLAGRQFKPDEESLNRKVPAMLERQARYTRHVMWLTPDGVGEETRALLQEKALAGSEFDEHGADKSVSRVISEADMKLKILADWGALKYKDLAEVEAAVQWWLDAAEGGADKIAQEWDVREARTLKAAGVLAKAMRNPKRKTAVDGKGFLQKANEVWQGHFLFHHLMEDLTRFASDEDRAAAKRYIDWLDLEIQKAGTRVASERIAKQEELRRAVESIYGKSFREVISEMNAIDGRFEKYMGESDDGVKVPATKARALQLLVSLQQIGYAAEVEDEENPGQMKTVYMGGYWENIVENGRVGQAEEMLSLMSDADLNFIKWMRQWYEKNRAGISETCERIFGVGVYAELGNYMPVKMLLDPKGLENGAGATWQIYPKALTPRVRNKRDFDTSADIFTMWSERLEESIQWKHHAELGIELRGIFGRSELQKAIRANHGAKVLGQVKGFVTDILNGKGVKQEMMVNPFLDKARQFAALGGLGGNVGVMIKQTTSIPAFGFEIGVWRTFRHLVGGLTAQGMEDIRKIAQSEEFRNRWHDGYSEEVANALSADNPGLLMRLWMKSMVTNKAGDCVPALLIGHGIYRDGINEGLSERDAMARTWMIVERTQQSSRIENRTAFQRRNALGNAIYQFLSTQNQMLNYEVRSIRDVIADPKNPKKWGVFLRNATLVHFVLSSFYYWAGELYKAMLGQEPSEDQLKDWVVGMIVGPVGALYGVGTTTVDAVESWVKGYSYGSNNAVPALSWLGQVVVRDPSLLIHDIFDGKKSWDDVCDDMLRWLSDFNATFRDLRKIYRFRIQEEKQ